MRHRHLVDGVGYTPAAVEDVLERGAPQDWVDLRDAVRAEPWGEVAQTVFDVCRSTEIYGAGPLWEAFVVSTLSAAAHLQEFIPDALVGGTAAAVHADHRFSHDDDHVVVNLVERYESILENLESQAGWQTARIKPPVLILGNLDGVDTGIRNLMRTEPLETEVHQSKNGPIVLPTLPEMARIKAWLVLTRNATRDYLDFVALADRIEGKEGGRRAHPRAAADGPAPQKNGTSAVLQLTKQLAEPRPRDLGNGDVGVYRLLSDEWKDWQKVIHAAKRLGVILLDGSPVRHNRTGSSPDGQPYVGGEMLIAKTGDHRSPLGFAPDYDRDFDH